MLGLRIRVRGSPATTLALAQDEYLVSTGASWHRRGGQRRAELYFHGTGIDDRQDSLRWFWVSDPPRGSWIEITVVDTLTAANPRRPYRRFGAIRWRRLMARIRVDFLKRIARLEARLRRLEAGIPYRPPMWSPRAPAIAFQVTLNGQKLGRVAVADPGSLTVDVVAKKRPERQSVYLNVHGGDQLGQGTWRSRDWSWGKLRRLEVGDRVRIAIVAPSRLSNSRVRVNSSEPTERAEIIAKLKQLKPLVSPDHHKRETAAMIRSERERPPARPYPRE